LIDSISEGYATINRRPWLVLVPILLNVYLWFGPQVSLGPLIGDFVGALKSVQPAALAETGDMQPIFDCLAANGEVDLRKQLAPLNAIPTLAPYVIGTGVRLPGVCGSPLAQEVPQLIDGRRTDTLQIGTIGGALLSFVLINALALALSSLFLAQVAAAVRREWAGAAGARRALRIGLAILGSIGIMLGVGLALGLPLLFFATLLLFFNQTIGLLAIELLFALGFWLRIYIGFTPEAIVIGDLGPLRAIYMSFNVVRRNFWATLGFLAISLTITLGSGVIWYRLLGSTIGLVVAIVGSAYIGSGLLAARMAFFRERQRRWQAAPAKSGVRVRN
jgi:hypothetical protein